jgi:hypothetical protein
MQRFCTLVLFLSAFCLASNATHAQGVPTPQQTVRMAVAPAHKGPRVNEFTVEEQVGGLGTAFEQLGDGELLEGGPRRRQALEVFADDAGVDHAEVKG